MKDREWRNIEPSTTSHVVRDARFASGFRAAAGQAPVNSSACRRKAITSHPGMLVGCACSTSQQSPRGDLIDASPAPRGSC